MPGIDYGRLRAEITIEEVLALLGFQPVSRRGDQLHGPCPVHKSTRPRSRVFSVHLGNRRYYCHKCGSHGNQLELWAVISKLPFYEACLDLCRALGRDVPWLTRPRQRTEKEAPVTPPPIDLPTNID